jgi:hypothetical protein
MTETNINVLDGVIMGTIGPNFNLNQLANIVCRGAVH